MTGRPEVQESCPRTWVCELCGLVYEGDAAPVCQHPGWPWGPGFSAADPELRMRGLWMRKKFGRRPMTPYDGDVQPGLTDPTYHVLMRETTP